MQIKMLRQSVTIDLGSTATNTAVDHNYVYLTNIPTSIGMRFVIQVVKHIEQRNEADRVYNLQLVGDNTTGFWTIKFTSKKLYPVEYNISAPDPQ